MAQYSTIIVPLACFLLLLLFCSRPAMGREDEEDHRTTAVGTQILHLRSQIDALKSALAAGGQV
jgi:hypothetical protein